MRKLKEFKIYHLIKKTYYFIFDTEKNWDNEVKKLGKNSVISYDVNSKKRKLITKAYIKFTFPILEKIIKKNKNKKFSILDFGCGYGRFSYELTNYFRPKEVIGVDVSKEILKFTKNNNINKFYQLNDFINIKKYQKEYFDIIFIFGVMGGIKNRNIDFYFQYFFKILKKKWNYIYG